VTFGDPQIAQIPQISFYMFRNRRNLRNLWITEPFDLSPYCANINKCSGPAKDNLHRCASGSTELAEVSRRNFGESPPRN